MTPALTLKSIDVFTDDLVGAVVIAFLRRSALCHFG